MIAPPNEINSHIRLTTQIILTENVKICKQKIMKFSKGMKMVVKRRKREYNKHVKCVKMYQIHNIELEEQI